MEYIPDQGELPEGVGLLAHRGDYRLKQVVGVNCQPIKIYTRLMEPIASTPYPYLSPSSDLWAWQIWIFSYKYNNTRWEPLLYSRLVKHSLGKGGTWAKPKEKKLTSKAKFLPKGASCSVILYTLTEPLDLLISMLEAVLNKTYNHKYKTHPLYDGNLQNYFDQQYVTRPPVFTPHHQTLSVPDLLPISSPIVGGCIIQQIVCHYNPLFANVPDEIRNLTNSKARFFYNIILNELQEQSSLRMQDSDAGRLGNIEILHWTNCDDHGRSWIDYATHKEGDICKKVDFWIKDFVDLPPTVSLIVRCCLFNDNEIAADHIVEITPPLAGKKLQFQANQQLTNIQVTVWVKRDETSWIIYDEATTLMRSISMSMSFGGSKYNLDKLRLPKDHQYDSELLKSFSTFTRVSREREPLEIGGYKLDSWVPIVRSKRMQVRQALPSESKGMYFKSGWDSTKIEKSDILFYDWLRSMIEKSDGDIFLVDPFFDVDALDLIVRLREINFNKLSIVCCTQANSKPTGNNEVTDKTMSARKETMLNYLEKNAVIVSGIPLYIYDLTNTPIKTDQHFHDRYLIFLSESRTSGYNFSNSIQGATKKVPLLVTEIPGDILPEVVAYIHDLLSPKASTEINSYWVHEMYMPKINPKERESELEVSKQAWDYQKLALGAALLVRDDVFHVNETQFSNFLHLLSTSTQQDVNTLLDGVGCALANGILKISSLLPTDDHNNYDFVCAQIYIHLYRQNTSLCLHNYLMERKLFYVQREWLNFKKVLTHDELFIQRFKSISFIDALASYHSQNFDPLPMYIGKDSWGSIMVSKIMARSEYGWLAKYFDDLITEIIGFDWNQGSQSNRSVLIHSSMIACTLFDYQFRHWSTMSALLASPHPSVRVCAAKLLLEKWNIIGVQSADFNETLANIKVSLNSPQEALLILVSELGNHIWKIDTQHDFRLDSSDLNETDPNFQSTLKEIVSLDTELIRTNLTEIIRFGSGQYHVIRPQGVYHKLLKPLIAANHLTPDDVFEVFAQLLESAFRASYNDSTSNLRSNNPYLTALCLTYVEALIKCDKLKQETAISKLVHDAQKLFYVVRKPLFCVRYTSESSDSSLKLYWMIYLMCLIRKFINEVQAVSIDKLFTEHTSSIKLLLDYLIKHSIVDPDECLIVFNDAQ